ncbi:unnamed protein product [Paramecium pentaurelia]|uniref:Protein kinase domain-containing protein n=1 Tax=Paramecium pentaurelia TaxID=43138 RepID=A0A8S1V4X2_9CILI|nr:unnamed protein product [Paramecium pentaurelia]
MDQNQQQQILVFYTFCKQTQQLQTKRTFFNDELIGSGNEGVVFLAKPQDWCFNVNQVAIKIQRGYNQKIFEFYEKLSQQQHKLNQNESNEKSYIIKIYEICLSQQKDLVIIMEIGGQDLYRYFKENKEVDFKRKEQICLQLALAIKQLHQLKYVHRDIKPENFVIVNNEFKLIDFGLTKQIDEKQMTMNVGSRIFQAPEILKGDGHYTFSVDIWSLGCTFFEIFANQELLQAETYLDALNMIVDHIKNQKYIYNRIETLNISQAWKDLIQKMFNHIPDKRITSTEVVFTIQSFLNVINNKSTNNFSFQNNQRCQTPQSNTVFPNSQQNIPQIINHFPQQQNGVIQNNNTFLNINSKITPFQGFNQQMNTKCNENQQIFPPKFQTPNLQNFKNIQTTKAQVQQNSQANICLMTQQEQIPKQNGILNQHQYVLSTQQLPNQKNDQQMFFNNDTKFPVQEQIHQQFNLRIQKLETDLQAAKNEIKNLQDENNKLKNEKQLLSDENGEIKNQIRTYIQQQQSSIKVLHQYINQSQQQQS